MEFPVTIKIAKSAFTVSQLKRSVLGFFMDIHHNVQEDVPSKTKLINDKKITEKMLQTVPKLVKKTSLSELMETDEVESVLEYIFIKLESRCFRLHPIT